MNKNTFLADLIQNLGFIAAIAVAISQYTLDDTFRMFFGNQENLYKSTSVIALIISIGIILGIFVFRYALLNKIYLPFSGKKQYIRKLNEINSEKNKIKYEKGEEAAQVYQNTIEFPVEPKSIQSIHLGFLFLFGAIISFLVMVVSPILWVLVLCYLAFICLTVGAISIFSVQLYRNNEYKKQREDTDQVIINRINEFFADNIKIISDLQDPNNLINPLRTIILEHPTRGKFRVDCLAYDPSKYFSIQQMDNSEN